MGCRFLGRLAGAVERFAVAFGDCGPDHASPIEIGAFAHGIAFRFIVHESQNTLRNGFRIAEGDKEPATFVQ